MGQDIRFGEQSCEFGRNFANKLWNATRFVLMKRDEYKATLPKTEFENEDTELNNVVASEAKQSRGGDAYGLLRRGKPLVAMTEPPSTLVDKWILSRANRTARDIRAAFDKYEINEVTKLLYDFIWRDYCDWYLEIVKLQPDSVPLAVEILEGILRMLHPIMPFVTEELWHALTGEDESVLIGRDDYITADEGKIDFDIEVAFLIIQDSIEAIRTVRSTLKLAPSKQAEIIIQARGSGINAVTKEPVSDVIRRTVLMPCQNILERFSNASMLIIDDSQRDYSTKEYTSEIRQHVRVFVKIQERSHDEKTKEKERLTKELARVQSLYDQGRAKLENENFRLRAPVEILQKENDKLINYKSQIEQLSASIAELT
jgi:valyl-tRNA synthetase